MNAQLFFREKVAVKKSMRNFNNALQTTLPRERNNSLTPPCGQLSIPVLSLFSICNYHNSLPNKLFRISVKFMFYFLHIITLDGARMKFLEYTDEIREGDTVIVYISSDDLKQIIIKKGETYQSKFG